MDNLTWVLSETLLVLLRWVSRAPSHYACWGAPPSPPRGTRSPSLGRLGGQLARRPSPPLQRTVGGSEGGGGRFWLWTNRFQPVPVHSSGQTGHAEIEFAVQGLDRTTFRRTLARCMSMFLPWLPAFWWRSEVRIQQLVHKGAQRKKMSHRAPREHNHSWSCGCFCLCAVCLPQPGDRFWVLTVPWVPARKIRVKSPLPPGRGLSSALPAAGTRRPPLRSPCGDRQNPAAAPPAPLPPSRTPPPSSIPCPRPIPSSIYTMPRFVLLAATE